MGLISIPTITDGSGIDANDVNNPLNTIVNEINGNLDYNNLADSAITSAKVADSAVTADKISSSAITNTKISDGATTGAKIDLATSAGRSTIGSGTAVGATPTKIGSTFNYTVPSGCTRVILMLTVRLNAQNTALQDMGVFVKYDGGTYTTPSSVITTATQYHGGMAPVIDSFPVTAGTKAFEVFAFTTAGSTTFAAVSSMQIIPLYG